VALGDFLTRPRVAARARFAEPAPERSPQ
jgi:hypothetical protein